MGVFQINHNISSINVQRNLGQTSLALGKSLEKLSSGLRINSGWDGPADLNISEQLRSQIGGIKSAIRNTQEAMNFVAVGEGALAEISNMLVDLRAKAVHAANEDLVSSGQREADQAEVDAIVLAVDQIIASTTYAGQAVFGNGSQTFHVGPNGVAGVDTVDFDLGGPSAAELTIDTIDLTAAGGGAAAMAIISTAIGDVAELRGDYGSFMRHQLQATINSLNVQLENVTATESYIRDTNMAEEVSEYTKQQILVQAGMSVLAQANVSSQSVLQLLG